MRCSNCSQSMGEIERDNQHILHCKNCGASFFEENGINRISLETASELSLDKQTDELSGEEKKCPKDETTLHTISQNEAIPATVTLLQCATCRGIFVYPEDLLSFKKAQQAKLNYFSSWNIPLSSLRTVAVLSVVVFFSAIFFTSYFYTKPTTPTNAESIVKKLYFNRSSAYLFVSFQTQEPMNSRITIWDKTTGEKIEKNITLEPQTLHDITLTGQLNHDLWYQITLVSPNGGTVSTDFSKISPASIH